MIKALRIFLILFLVILLGAIGYFIVKRDEILKSSISYIIQKLKKDDHLILKVGSAKFTGLNEVKAEGITLVPELGDSLLKIGQGRVGVAILPLLTGKIRITTLNIDHAWIHLVNKNGVRNYEFYFKKKGGKKKSLPLSQLLDGLINQALYQVPDNLEVHQFYLSWKRDESFYSLNIPNALMENHKLNSTLVWSEASYPWHLNGFLRPSDKKINLKLFSEKGPLSFPILKTKFNLDLSADTLQGALNGEELNSEEISVQLSGGVNQLKIHHPKLSDGFIQFPYLSFDGTIHLSQNTVSVDSNSTLEISQIKAHPYISYTFSKNKIYSLRFKTDLAPAQAFFDALPNGLFESMEGIKVKGNLAYHLNFHLEEEHPFDLDFNAGFTRENFKILQFGKENLTKINSSFAYTPYEYGKPMRTRIIGPSNPYYTPLNSISPYLRDALISSEDPNFYGHRGIDEYAFRKVIAIDYKAKSFKRGASTISMQLVKNVFLNRQKTILRKAEEMLITWLLENTNLTTKQRILEVYLNIIEWGPNIYGIGEASQFYFNKAPYDLSLGESIFLTHIIPRPKAYQYSFNPNGSLKDYIKGYYRFISGNLLNKGKIVPTDTLSMFQINLRGPAAKYVIKTPDSLSSPVDSLDFPIDERMQDPTPGQNPNR